MFGYFQRRQQLDLEAACGEHSVAKNTGTSGFDPPLPFRNDQQLGRVWAISEPVTAYL